MTDTLTDRRLQLFAFTQAEHKHRYLAILAAFDVAREQSRLQLGAGDIVERVAGVHSEEEALFALDQLHGWDLLERIQDERRVRTVAEYKQRRSVYLMTELGWLAYTAVRGVLEARPGEAELRRLVLAKVLEELGALGEAVRAEDAERVALHLDEVHRMLSDLAHHASRFLLATSELSTTWDADPQSFITHKRRLLGHLDGFLATLSAHRPLLGKAVAALLPHRERVVELAAEASVAVQGEARVRAGQRFDGIVAWFEASPRTPSQAATLEERTTRAIRDLTGLLRRVFDATAGGVSRATRLDELAAWFVACPHDAAAHALAHATSGLQRARHFGGAEVDEIEPSTSWWDAAPAPVDTLLRKRGRTASPPPPTPLPDRARASLRLRARQRAAREADQLASEGLVASLGDMTPLDDAQLAVLLRLLSRALHARGAAHTQAQTVHGRLRMTLTQAAGDTVVPTRRGTLRLVGFHLAVEPSGRMSA